MQHLIRHLTRFVYTSQVRESVMELRKQPIDRAWQQVLRFAVTTLPRARVFAYHDHYGNAVHYFDIPGHHAKLDIWIESVVQITTLPELPESLPEAEWDSLDALDRAGEHMDWLAPSRFARETATLADFARSIGFSRTADPLTLLRALTSRLYAEIDYEPRSTRVDSPIDDALEHRAGVCQDFAHIMTALVRHVGIPCRYVSGYMAHRHDASSSHDRSPENATHAWIEAFLPSLGWIGFDPTNDTLADDRHIAVAVGRDYADVPPTRGVFKGSAGSELSVAVAVTPAEIPVSARELSPSVSWIVPPRPDIVMGDEVDEQQQQQQQ